MSLHTYTDVIQRSPEWYELRCGLVTASTIGALITAAAPGADAYECPECAAPPAEPCISLRGGTPIKTMHSGRHEAAAANASTAEPVLRVADNDTSRGLIHTLAAERIRRMGEDTPMTSDMWRGVDSEPYAREAYEKHAGVEVVEAGFMVRDFGKFKIGASPDGLIGSVGGLEIKAPRAKTHMQSVLADEVPAHYMAQVQTFLLVSGREWCDFVSFCGAMHLWVKRVLPRAEWFEVIEQAAESAETAIVATVKRYTEATRALPLTDPIPETDEIVI